MMLHTLNAAPDSRAFCDCANLLQPEDALLLMGDGVYAALADTAAYGVIASSGAKLFVLHSDSAAAGIVQRLGSEVTIADYDQFVSLTELYTKQLAWY